MQRSLQLRSLLAAGDRRSIGGVPEVLAVVLQDSRRLSELLECLGDDDAGIRMRAADALEKLSRTAINQLQAYAPVLLDVFEQTGQKEVQWHLAVLIPRLRLDPSERLRTRELLKHCLGVESSIVRTFALQGLFDLCRQEASLRPEVVDLLRMAERSGTPAMRARSRILLRSLES